MSSDLYVYKYILYISGKRLLHITSLGWKMRTPSRLHQADHSGGLISRTPMQDSIYLDLSSTGDCQQLQPQQT